MKGKVSTLNYFFIRRADKIFTGELTPSQLISGGNSSLWREQRCCSIQNAERQLAAEIHWTPERTTGSRSYSCHTALSSTTHSSHINHTGRKKKSLSRDSDCSRMGQNIMSDKTDRSGWECFYRVAAAAAYEIFCLFEDLCYLSSCCYSLAANLVKFLFSI